MRDSYRYLSNLRSAWQPALLLVWMSTACTAQLPASEIGLDFSTGRTARNAGGDNGRRRRSGRRPRDCFFASTARRPAQANTGRRVLSRTGSRSPISSPSRSAPMFPQGFTKPNLSAGTACRPFECSRSPTSRSLPTSGNNHTIEQAQALTLGQLVNGRTDAEQADFYSDRIGRRRES